MKCSNLSHLSGWIWPLISFCSLVAVCFPSIAQEAVNKVEATPPNVWQTLIVPDTKDSQELETFLDSTKKRQPKTGEQYVEMQRALRTVAKTLVELNTDSSSRLFKKAEAEFVNASDLLIGNEGPEAQRKTFERFREYLTARPKIEFADIQMSILAGQNLEQLADYGLAKEAYKTFAEIFREKKDPNLVEIISMLEANARRLDLPGNPFKLVGTTMSGDDFDIASLKGKIVLIYFWSSATAACEREHPFLVSLYDKYKNRGFEVVGIGLDDKKELAQSFMKRLQVPWINLWESRKNGVSKVMEAFGVSAIPSFFLLDKEGKVVTIEARGKVLVNLLETLLPDESKSVSSDK